MHVTCERLERIERRSATLGVRELRRAFRTNGDDLALALRCRRFKEPDMKTPIVPALLIMLGIPLMLHKDSPKS